MDEKLVDSFILKIITVEDSLLMADRLKMILGEIDHVEYVGNAQNISSALQLINQQMPNVAILDIHLEGDMPDKNGLDLLACLREKFPEMTIIMLTNLSDPQYRHICFEYGADYFFDKSHDFDQIPEVIEKIRESWKKK